MTGGDPARTMGFLEHFAELRLRVLLGLGGAMLCGLLAYIFVDPLYALLLRPLTLAAPGVQLNYLSPVEPFYVDLKIALYTGVALGSPWLLYQLWLFIAPGLTPAERRAVRPVLPLIFVLFILGVAFVYAFLLPVSMRFLMGMAHQGLAPMLTQDRYFGFVVGMCLGGGLIFELPVVLCLMGYLGLVSASFLWRHTGWAAVILMTLAAVITPTGDAFTMLVLTAPLLVLYLASVILVWAIRRRIDKRAA